jgi:GT2 family glycosyltransferase
LPEFDTSIVVATCSRAHFLRGALGSLLVEAASWRFPVEIVIVDDGSTDDTPQLLEELKQASSVPLVVVAGERSGVAAARNMGAAHARGTWLASFDDDQIALPGWLASLRHLADEKNCLCIAGPLELSLVNGEDPAELGPRVRKILGELLVGKEPQQGVLPASNNVLIRRDIFEQLGGYDISFTEGAEDSDLFQRVLEAGHAIWFQPAARALHITPDSRLRHSNLRWTSLRLGAGDARQSARRGLLALLKPACVRVAVSLVRDLPLLLVAILTNNKRLLLDVQCSLWYAQGMLRALPAFLGSNPNASHFLRSLDFRARNGERKETTLRSSQTSS